MSGRDAVGCLNMMSWRDTMEGQGCGGVLKYQELKGYHGREGMRWCARIR